MTSRGSWHFAPVIGAMSLSLAGTAQAQESPETSPPAPIAHTDVPPIPQPAPPPETVDAIAGRAVAEVLMGSGIATIGFVAGPKLTGGVSCRACLFAAGFAGANATFPLGVYWGGNLAHGNGSFWLTMAAPWVVSATTFGAIVFDKNYDGSPAIQIGAIGGAIAAPISVMLYELTHANRRASTLRPCATLSPQIAVAPRGDGLAIHLSGQF